MNATAIGLAARAVGLAAIIVLAAALGLVAGSLIQGQADGDAGYPAGWQGGAAVPVSRTAASFFSLEAISALQAARGDAAASAEDYADYGLRHGKAEAGATHVDYVDQAKQRSAAIEPVAEPQYVDYVDQAKQRSAAIEPVAAPEASKETLGKPTVR